MGDRAGKGWWWALGAWALFLGGVLVLAWSGHLPLAWLGRIPHYDKLGHFVLIGLASWLGWRASHRRVARLGPVPVPVVPALVLALTAFEEVLQLWSPNRTASWEDLGADVAGVVFFLAVDLAWRRWREGRGGGASA